MNPSLISFAILAAMLAAGDLLAVKTRAIVDSMLTFSVILCIAFWLGMPYSVIENSYFLPLAYVCLALMLTNMGSTITLDQFSREWKTVCIGFLEVIAICLIVYFVGSMFLDRIYAYAGAPIVAGGFVAYLIMAEPIAAVGATKTASFCLLLMTAQSLIGIPVASVLVKREANRFLSTGEYLAFIHEGAADLSDASGKKRRSLRIIPEIPESYNKPMLILTKTALVAIAGVAVSNALDGKLNFLICCLIMGILATQIGFLDRDALGKAGADGLIILIVIVYTFEGVHDITPSLFLSLLGPFFLIMAIGIAAILLASLLLSKVFHTSYLLATAIGLTALFGFPATFYIAKEVAEACGHNKDEQTALENYLVPKLMVAGFATTSIGSVVAASAMLPGLMTLLG